MKETKIEILNRIFIELVGISPSELTTAERNIDLTTGTVLVSQAKNWKGEYTNDGE